MHSISYLLIGLLSIFVIIAVMVSQTNVSVLAGIVIGGLTLALVPIIIYSMRKTPKRDHKHEDSDLFK